MRTREQNAAYMRAWRGRLSAGVDAAYQREYKRRRRAQVIAHVDGGGSEHRRECGGGGDAVIGWLIRNGLPEEGFRVLCHNCNCARGFYGRCPHENEE